MDGRCCKKYLPSFFSVILLIRLRLNKGIHIFDILLFGKDGLIIRYNLFCFHSPVPKQAVSGEGEDFCSDHIGKLIVYDIEINGVETAYLTAGVEGKDRLQMLYIPHIGGAAAVGVGIFLDDLVIVFTGLCGNLSGCQDRCIGFFTQSRKVSGHSGDFAGSTDGDGTCLEGTVCFGSSIGDGILVGGTYQSFDYHLIRYYIDEISAFCDNGMDSDMVIIPEGFTLVSQGGKSEGGCI